MSEDREVSIGKSEDFCQCSVNRCILTPVTQNKAYDYSLVYWEPKRIGAETKSFKKEILKISLYFSEIA